MKVTNVRSSIFETPVWLFHEGRWHKGSVRRDVAGDFGYRLFWVNSVTGLPFVTVTPLLPLMLSRNINP